MNKYEKAAVVLCLITVTTATYAFLADDRVAGFVIAAVISQ
jgi:hypothetical protein